MNKGEIQAVHDDDLVSLLKSLDVYDEVINGSAKCLFCGKSITVDNLQCVFPQNNEIKYCCSEDKCYESLLNKGDVSD